MFSKIKDFFINLLKPQLLIFVSFVLVVMTFLFFFNRQGEEYVHSMLKSDLEYLYIKEKKNYVIRKKSLDFTNSKIEEKSIQERLKEQISQIRARARRHLNVVIFYYSKYYSSIVMSAVFGVFGGMLFIFISLRGWKESNNNLLIIFIISSSISALFAVIPSLFQQSQNIENNEQLYRGHIYLENRIRSYVAYYKTCDDNNSISPKEFMLDIDNKMKNLDELTVLFDPKALEKLKTKIKNISNEMPKK